MKLCDTCIYHNQDEYHKPCIVYRDDCEFYEREESMTREKALMLALKIVDVCKRYGGEDRCSQCPFNVNGCFVTDGNNIPADWRASELIKSIEMQGRK